jgi:hypothetical protein
VSRLGPDAKCPEIVDRLTRLLERQFVGSPGLVAVAEIVAQVDPVRPRDGANRLALLGRRPPRAGVPGVATSSVAVRYGYIGGEMLAVTSWTGMSVAIVVAAVELLGQRRAGDLEQVPNLFLQLGRVSHERRVEFHFEINGRTAGAVVVVGHCSASE